MVIFARLMSSHIRAITTKCTTCHSRDSPVFRPAIAVCTWHNSLFDLQNWVTIVHRLQWHNKEQFNCSLCGLTFRIRQSYPNCGGAGSEFEQHKDKSPSPHSSRSSENANYKQWYVFTCNSVTLLPFSSFSSDAALCKRDVQELVRMAKNDNYQKWINYSSTIWTVLTHSFSPLIHLFFSVVYHPNTKNNHLLAICLITVPKFTISQSEAVSTFLIPSDIEPLMA